MTRKSLLPSPYRRVLTAKSLLQRLAVLRNVEAFQLLLQRDAQRHEDADQLEQHIGDAAAPHEGDGHAIELDQELLRTALQETGGAADRRRGEDAYQQRADHAADAVDPEHVERVVVIEAMLQPVQAQYRQRRQ